MSGQNDNAQEPFVVINGVRLDDGQAMTVRVALESFAADLYGGGLGDDDHGKTMAALYLTRINEIRAMIRAGR